MKQKITRTLLALLVVGFASTETYADGLERDMDRLGMDYRRIALPAAEPLLCQSECVGDVQCKSFTYVKPGLHGSGAICYLKNGTPSPTPNNCCVSGLRPNITHAHAQSVKYQAHQTWLTRVVPRASITGQHDTLRDYAKKCDDATGIPVPSFNCDAGKSVPGQGNGIVCDQPNVLNSGCDPGSKFQVLPGGNADAVAVAHCRKVGLPVSGSTYNDIAVIQYNKKNGATCFYQALTDLPGQNVPAPLSAGESPWQASSTASWISPAGTEAIGCTGCHDNGGFIRSAYLAQLRTPPHMLPSTATGFNNLNTPVKYVGLDYATNRSWNITTSPAAGDTGTSCHACHRLAVNNFSRNGTAALFANIATAPTQAAKNPHSATSPIWMRPGQITYNAGAEASATKYRDCALGFLNSGFVTAPPGCTITALAEPWNPVACHVFDDGYTNISPPSEAIYFAGNSAACTPDNTARGLCRRWFGRCVSTTDNVAVNFRTFGDGNSNATTLSDAVSNRAPNVSCIPDGTSTGKCRRWFGIPATADGRAVECYLFDDGLSNLVGPTDAIYYRAPGKVCMPADGSPTGLCRKWFGNCHVTNQQAPLDPRALTVTVSPSFVKANMPQTFTVTIKDVLSGVAVTEGDVFKNNNKIGKVGNALAATFAAQLISGGCHWVPAECDDSPRPRCTKPHKECAPSEWVVDPYDLKVKSPGFIDANVPLTINP